jgi:hypothetical protein
MKSPDNNKSRILLTPSRIIPVATIVVLLGAVYVFMFRSDLGLVQSAGAQINPQRIGESITQQIEQAPKSSLESAGGQASPPPAAAETPAGGEIPVIPAENAPGETAQPAETGAGTVYDTQPGSRFYVDSTGVGGTKFTDMDAASVQALVLQIPDIAKEAPEVQRMMLDTLMPILLRFRTMVSPPKAFENVGAEGTVPWKSDSSRYSPFDTVGGGGPPVGAAQPIPPFPPLEQVGGPQEQGPNAQQVASAFKLVGIIGEPGDYRAILTGPKSLQVRIGDEFVTVGETVFTVADITFGAVRIVNKARAGDTGLIQFVSRQGIADVSISY